ncbi:MAG: rhodanese-like domain-containing protein [Acidimicrobiia bacterium]
MTTTPPHIPTVSAHDAANRPDAVVLIDVREPDEWAAGHAPGAHHHPLGALDPNVVESGTTVYCICRSGGRSASATQALCDAGLDAHNVDGGMQTWGEAGLPMINTDGGIGTVI